MPVPTQVSTEQVWSQSQDTGSERPQPASTEGASTAMAIPTSSRAAGPYLREE